MLHMLPLPELSGTKTDMMSIGGRNLQSVASLGQQSLIFGIWLEFSVLTLLSTHRLCDLTRLSVLTPSKRMTCFGSWPITHYRRVVW